MDVAKHDEVGAWHRDEPDYWSEVQLKRDAGINHFDYQVMAVLSEADHRTMRMRDVAALAQSSLPQTVPGGPRLEEQGWVRRTPDPAERRSTLAHLTDAGWNKVDDTAPGHVTEVYRVVFDPLTKTQIHPMTAIAQRISRAVDRSPGE